MSKTRTGLQLYKYLMSETLGTVKGRTGSNLGII